jgi:hypothetical protein
MLGVAFVATITAASLIGLLWPVECVTTDIGTTDDGFDPNIRACTTRIGTVSSGDRQTARRQWVLVGATAGVAMVLVGGIATWWLSSRASVHRNDRPTDRPPFT